MKIQTSELSGEALNHAAAESLGFAPKLEAGQFGGYSVVICEPRLVAKYAMYHSPNSLGSWRVFDEHCAAFHRDPDGTCWATVGLSQCSGNDILEAFLRALVTERSGKEVDVPDELVNKGDASER